MDSSISINDMNWVSVMLWLTCWTPILSKTSSTSSRAIKFTFGRIIVIIIMLCRLHGYPWPSLATSPYPSSPLAGLQGNIPYPQIAAKCSSWLSRFCSAICGVHRSTSLMSSSLLLQQCPACLVHLTWIVFVMGGRWPHSWCLVGCCRPDLFNIARNILV